MSIRLGNGTVVAGGTVSFPLLSTMWADHILNDVSWLRADTFSWQSGDVYKSVYEKLVAEYATGTTETEGAITFKRTESGFKIAEATQEQAILDLYNSTGVAWYYILDTTNRRFKLPRAKHTSTNVDVFGNGITLGLTDGESNGGLNVSTGSANNYIAMKEQYNVPIGNIATSATAISTTDRKSLGVVSDPTKSGIVGKVQRENDSQYMYLYFFVGNYVQNQTAIDIGQMSEQLNGKVDLDMHNSQKPYIVETYDDGNGNGYRVWSDKWCEQGGDVGGIPGSGGATITLFKAMKGDYKIFLQARSLGGASMINDYPWVIDKTNTSFTADFVSASTTRSCWWKAEGYIL